MKVLVIGGFLGSGKTSFLLQLAQYIIANSTSESEYKVAILENEIGDVGVDDKTLNAGGYNVETLFAGCACCTSAESVPVSIRKIRDTLKPDWVILESTGVAYPANIKENIEDSLHIESRVCALVDAKRWKRFLIPMQMLLSGQLSGAETIIINKKDLVDEATLKEVLTSVAGYNSTAQLLPTSAASPIDSSVFNAVLGVANF